MRRLVLVVCLALLPACGTLPKPECDPASQVANAPLRCDTAVSAALDVLPADHPDIARIQFLYGDARPYDCGAIPLPQSEEQPVCAYVVFTFTGYPRQYVALTQWHGSLAAASPAPY